MSDVQLHRYNTATIALMEKSMKRWAEEISTPDQPVEPYFILLDFQGIQELERRQFINQIPTSFALTDEQVDVLIDTGGYLLRSHPEFLRLQADLAADERSNR